MRGMQPVRYGNYAGCTVQIGVFITYVITHIRFPRTVASGESLRTYCLLSLHFLPVLTLQIGLMRHAARCLLRPLPISRLVAPGRSAGYGQRIAMAGVSTASNGANGRPNHWHGAGAAEFDMRSEYLLVFEISLVHMTKASGNPR